MNLYEYWDALCAECDAFHQEMRDPGQYAQLHRELEQNACRNILSTYGYSLGLASPSVMTKFIIKNHKTGRVLRQPKPDQMYQAIWYDADGNPAAIEDYADMHPGALCTKSETTFFVCRQDAVWTARYSEYSSRHTLDSTHFKIVCDAQQRLRGFYKITAGNDSLEAEEYDYSRADEGVVICLYTYYIGKAQGSSKEIPVGFKGSPAVQWKYEIEADETGRFKSLTTFPNKEGVFVRHEHITFAPDTKLKIKIH